MNTLRLALAASGAAALSPVAQAGTDVFFNPLTQSAVVAVPNAMAEIMSPWQTPPGITQTNLTSLNDPDIRFQMMWSDPSSADVIPAMLQDQSARFPFGRLQAQAFLQRMGCHTIFRGHEKVEEGFRHVYDHPNVSLFTVFSSGGAENQDLPEDSSYREVTPMAATLRYKDGKSEVKPFLIDYQSFTTPARNKFYQSAPEITHQA